MSQVLLAENAVAPGTPSSGKSSIYPKSDGKWYSKDDAGVEYPLTGIAGSDTQVLFNDGGALNGDAGLVYNKTTDKLTIGGSLSVPSIVTGSGALTITPAAGSGLNINLSTTGDFAVNTDDLYVDTSTGNVGIGTTSPGQQLTMVGTGVNGGRLSVSGNSNGLLSHIFDNLAGGNATAVEVNLTDQTTASVLFRYNASTFANSGINFAQGGSLVGNGTGGLSVAATNAAGALRFYAGGTTERMRVHSDGNVGIGTTSPSGLLDINSDILRLRTAKTPATAGAAGNQGDFAWDSGFFYICIATNTWQRVAHATW